MRFFLSSTSKKIAWNVSFLMWFVLLGIGVSLNGMEKKFRSQTPSIKNPKPLIITYFEEKYVSQEAIKRFIKTLVDDQGLLEALHIPAQAAPHAAEPQTRPETKYSTDVEIYQTDSGENLYANINKAKFDLRPVVIITGGDKGGGFVALTNNPNLEDNSIHSVILFDPKIGKIDIGSIGSVIKGGKTEINFGKIQNRVYNFYSRYGLVNNKSVDTKFVFRKFTPAQNGFGVAGSKIVNILCGGEIANEDIDINLFEYEWSYVSGYYWKSLIVDNILSMNIPAIIKKSDKFRFNWDLECNPNSKVLSIHRHVMWNEDKNIWENSKEKWFFGITKLSGDDEQKINDAIDSERTYNVKLQKAVESTVADEKLKDEIEILRQENRRLAEHGKGNKGEENVEQPSEAPAVEPSVEFQKGEESELPAAASSFEPEEVADITPPPPPMPMPKPVVENRFRLLKTPTPPKISKSEGLEPVIPERSDNIKEIISRLYEYFPKMEKGESTQILTGKINMFFSKEYPRDTDNPQYLWESIYTAIKEDTALSVLIALVFSLNAITLRDYELQETKLVKKCINKINENIKKAGYLKDDFLNYNTGEETVYNEKTGVPQAITIIRKFQADAVSVNTLKDQFYKLFPKLERATSTTQTPKPGTQEPKKLSKQPGFVRQMKEIISMELDEIKDAFDSANKEKLEKIKAALDTVLRRCNRLKSLDEMQSFLQDLKSLDENLPSKLLYVANRFIEFNSKTERPVAFLTILDMTLGQLTTYVKNGGVSNLKVILDQFINKGSVIPQPSSSSSSSSAQASSSSPTTSKLKTQGQMEEESEVLKKQMREEIDLIVKRVRGLVDDEHLGILKNKLMKAARVEGVNVKAMALMKQLKRIQENEEFVDDEELQKLNKIIEDMQ